METQIAEKPKTAHVRSSCWAPRGVSCACPVDCLVQDSQQTQHFRGVAAGVLLTVLLATPNISGVSCDCPVGCPVEKWLGLWFWVQCGDRASLCSPLRGEQDSGTARANRTFQSRERNTRWLRDFTTNADGAVAQWRKRPGPPPERCYVSEMVRQRKGHDKILRLKTMEASPRGFLAGAPALPHVPGDRQATTCTYCCASQRCGL